METKCRDAGWTLVMGAMRQGTNYAHTCPAYYTHGVHITDLVWTWCMVGLVGQAPDMAHGQWCSIYQLEQQALARFGPTKLVNKQVACWAKHQVGSMGSM